MRSEEFTSETINPNVFRMGFERTTPYGKYTLLAKHGMIPLSKDNTLKTSNQFRVEAYLGKAQVGWVNFEIVGNKLEAIDVFVGENHRRKGIATAMYKFARELGNDIQPSSKQTDAGKAFWAGQKDLTEGLQHPKPKHSGTLKRI